MTASASLIRAAPAAVPSAPAQETRHTGASPLGPRLSAQLEAMRRGGMSATAIRRALGLSAEQALVAGVIAPPRMGPAGRQPGPKAHAAMRPAQRGQAMEAVLAAVAGAAGVAPQRLRGRGQDQGLTRIRHLAMLLLRERCAGTSLPAIGDFLDRDHSTVIYGCRRAAERLARDPDYRSLHARASDILNRPSSARLHAQG